MHLRGILLVFFRVLLVGFGLFRLGAARVPEIELFIGLNIGLYLWSPK